jgi:hypothetical protein
MRRFDSDPRLSFGNLPFSSEVGSAALWEAVRLIYLASTDPDIFHPHLELCRCFLLREQEFGWPVSQGMVSFHEGFLIFRGKESSIIEVEVGWLTIL